jgi:hypothetical protein
METAHDETQVELEMCDIETDMEIEESEDVGVQADLSSFDFVDAEVQCEEEPVPWTQEVSTQSDISFQSSHDIAIQANVAKFFNRHRVSQTTMSAFFVQDQDTQTDEAFRESVTTSDITTQLSTYFDRKTRRLQTVMKHKNAETQIAAELEDAEVQSPSDWLEVCRRSVVCIAHNTPNCLLRT